MEELRGLRLTAAYLGVKRKELLFFTGILVIFSLIGFLYGLPLEPVLYAVLLNLCLGLVHFALDFRRFASRYRELWQLVRAPLTWDQLPSPEHPLEEVYHELVASLLKEKANLEDESRRMRQELEEYYTLWVHQVKTPIAAARLLLQTGGGEENTAELEMELFKIERYVEMVLQYLRVESPSADLVIRRSSLDAIVRQAVRRYAPLFIRKRIALDYRGLDLEVLTDAKWLGFVVEQLLANGLKYTQAGSIAIYLDPERPFTLVIEDTGIGIPSEDLPRIFEKGYTGYAGRAERSSTGIGLYLCKRILDRLGHTIWVESTVGVGTKVKIGFAEVKPFLE